MNVTVNKKYSVPAKGLGEWQIIDLTIAFQTSDSYVAGGIDLTALLGSGGVLLDPALTQGWAIRQLVDDGTDTYLVTIENHKLVLETITRDNVGTTHLALTDMSDKYPIDTFPYIRMILKGPRGHPYVAMT
jgi:hypothetical protein